MDTSRKLFPKHWASGFDSVIWRGVNTDLKYRTDIEYLFCGTNLLSMLHGRIKHDSREEIMVDGDINPAMPVWHISLVPNVGQSKLYPLSSTRMLRKISIGNYAYFARPLLKRKIAECHGAKLLDSVKLLDMYIGIEHSAMSFIDSFSGNAGLILRFVNEARLWKDCINDGDKYYEPVTDDVKSNNLTQYNPLAVPRGANPYNSITIGDIAWNFLARCAQAICEYAISETVTKGFKMLNPFHYVTTGVFENIEHPLLKIRAGKLKELLEFIHTAHAETHSFYCRIAPSFLREIGIYPIV
jgi:hypothetical protein